MFAIARRTFSTAATQAAAQVPQGPKLLGRYTTLEHDLYRIMLGPNIRLRDQAFQQSKGRASYDLILHDGLVKPSVGDHFMGPNGASFRPNTFNLQNTVRLFKAPEFQVVHLPKGTKLPPDLVCLWEHSDHFSIQCTKPMPLPRLNNLISRLCSQKGTTYSKEEFLEKFPYLSATPI